MTDRTVRIQDDLLPLPPMVPAVFGRVDTFLRARGRTQLTAIAAIVMLAVTALDVVTGPEVAFSIFYLVPVGLIAWYLGWQGALLAAAAATAALFAADVLADAAYAHPVIRYWNALVRGSVFLLVAYALAVLSARLKLEQHMARTDPVTGLPNWRALEEIATRELARAQRLQAPITVAYLDVDDFKRVNDTRGHDAGNQLLAAIAATLRKGMRATDVIARAGGDEFVLLLPDCALTGARVALAHATDQLRTDLADWGVGFSVGAISYTTAPPLDLEALVRAADDLMYRVKAAGKNAVLHREL